MKHFKNLGRALDANDMKKVKGGCMDTTCYLQGMENCQGTIPGWDATGRDNCRANVINRCMQSCYEQPY